VEALQATTATSDVEQLLREVEDLATENHGEVIRQAIENASIVCPHCNFPLHATDWIRKVQEYAEKKKELHRVAKHTERVIDTNYEFMAIAGLEDAEKDSLIARCDGAQSRLHRLEYDVMQFHKTLEEEYPCLNCKRRFNPTFSPKLGIPIVPVKKDFFK